MYLSLKQGWISVLVILATAAGVRSIAADAAMPLVRAHSHNDYEHRRPLIDALEQGFCSVEADIYLVNDELLVAHDRAKVSPERTLAKLYLEPLRQRVRQNGGRVFRDGPPVILLIDVKSDAAATYARLRRALETYSDILTRFNNGKIETNAVTAIISGNRDRSALSKEAVRYAALDGRPEDLENGASRDLVPLVSEDWKKLFQWRGTGPLSEAERVKLDELVQKAHRQGRIIRFWGTTDREAFWTELLKARVDLLNADDLAGLAKFLRGRRAAE
jgi:hypothetical protein